MEISNNAGVRTEPWRDMASAADDLQAYPSKENILERGK
jgi:hypothetical protein